MSREIVKNTPFESFPNYTDEMYIGNEPCGQGHEYIFGGDFEHPLISDRWSYQHGGGESLDDDVLQATININANDSIFLYGDTVSVTHIRHKGNHCVSLTWKNKGTLAPWDEPLEYEKALATINKLRDNKFEQMTRKQIKEIIGE